MISTKAKQKIGAGIYTIPDIAFLLRLPRAKVNRWLNDFWDTRLANKYNSKYSWGEGRDKATTFFTLIEFYVFYQLRELNVSSKAILMAHEEMALQLKTAYPFASAKLLTDGKHILYGLADGTTVKADKTRQIALKEIIESFCKKIDFSESNLAEKYYPLGKTRNIVVDPHHQFGQPVINHTNILAETIYSLHKAGETNNFLSRLYNLPINEVEAAISLFTLKAA